MTFDPAARLDTGMKAGEAVTRAAQWWDKTGRHECARTANEGGVPSGILRGDPWDTLLQEEKLRIVKVWHHMFIRRPDALGADPDEKIRLGQPDGGA